MKQEYRYLRDDTLKRRVNDMRDANMPIPNIARTLGRTQPYTERLVLGAAEERAIYENRLRAAFMDGDPLGLED